MSDCRSSRPPARHVTSSASSWKRTPAALESAKSRSDARRLIEGAASNGGARRSLIPNQLAGGFGGVLRLDKTRAVEFPDRRKPASEGRWPI